MAPCTRRTPRTVIALLVLLSAAVTPTRAISANDPSTAEELRVRDGLPNFFARLAAGEPVRIAYLGGSITAAKGWRPKTLAWFQQQYPSVAVTEINAAISGTGSDYGAMRVAGDVLSKNPDLVFLEHRANGGGGYEAKSVEGIVRQIWQANPRTDICLVYTITEDMREVIRAGKQTSFGAIMEMVANHYGIPSIDLGIEIVKRETAGQLIFESRTAVEGKMVFSSDGSHPGDEGHELYRDIIARSMGKINQRAGSRPHSLPAPLESRCWEESQLVAIAEVARSAGWKAVDAASDAVYREDYGRTHAMLRGAVKCNQAGETLTLEWIGTTIGFSDIPQGAGTEVEVTVDNAALPIAIKRSQTETRRYARFFYLPEQPYGKHTAVLKVKQLPEGVSFYAGQILVAGKRLP